MLEGKQGEVNKALHLFAATELRKAYGTQGNAQLASLGEPLIARRAAPAAQSDYHIEQISQNALCHGSFVRFSH